MSFVREQQSSTDHGLEALEKEVGDKYAQYSKFKQMEPLVRKLIERYGANIYYLRWGLDLDIWFEQRLSRAPPKFIDYLTKLGLTYEGDKMNSVGHWDITITGVKQDDT